ncbi:MAG: hemerythrin domain-containing protein [Gallionellaceae bacterium]
MINIQWDKKFEVGHVRIDFEHQVFVDLIKSLSVATEQNSTHERNLRLMHEVKKYAEFHFVSEENIMLDAEYPNFAQHQQEHRLLLTSLEDKIFQYRREAVSLDQFAAFLFEWFAFHTTHKDLPIAEYIKATH